MKRNMFRRFLFPAGTVSLIMFVVLHCFLIHQGQAEAKRDSTETRILIITSQPYATEWFNSFNSEFVEEINKVRPIQPKISYEYIDGKIAADPVLSATVVAFL